MEELSSLVEEAAPKNSDLPSTSVGVSTTNRDTKAREFTESDAIPTFTHQDFELRIKPKHLCTTEEDGSGA